MRGQNDVLENISGNMLENTSVSMAESVSGSVSNRIATLRSEMTRVGIDIYIVPSTDHHHSEYVGEYFKFREYMTGFTGSAGTAVFTRDLSLIHI